MKRRMCGLEYGEMLIRIETRRKSRVSPFPDKRTHVPPTDGRQPSSPSLKEDRSERRGWNLF